MAPLVPLAVPSNPFLKDGYWLVPRAPGQRQLACPGGGHFLVEFDVRQRLAAYSMPASGKSKHKQATRRVPAMPVLPHRPYVESSRGGGDVEYRCQLPLAMVAKAFDLRSFTVISANAILF